MAFDPARILAWQIPVVRQHLTPRDTMLYALAVGFGHDPVDPRQLPFVYERDLRASPTMASVLAHPGFWMKDPATGIAWEHVVHGEQGIRIHRRLPVEGIVVGSTRVTAVVDKGIGRGALVYQERRVVDEASGEPICTATMTTVCRADGGCGGGGSSLRPPLSAVPDGPPHWTCDLSTLPHSALVFRLLGDGNPLHADPEVARRAGFERPILHGLCTFGVAGHALLRTVCDYDPSRLTEMEVRFSAPVLPGETIRIEGWRGGATVTFRARSLDSGRIVLDRGQARIDGTSSQPGA
jgi:acyl dehydratase